MSEAGRGAGRGCEEPGRGVFAAFYEDTTTTTDQKIIEGKVGLLALVKRHRHVGEFYLSNPCPGSAHMTALSTYDEMALDRRGREI